MDTQRIVFSQIAIVFLLASTVALLPSQTKSSSVKTISKILSIQSSRAEPPRVAFDELFRTETLSEWNIINSEKGSHNLNEQKNLFVHQGFRDGRPLQKVQLQPMTFSLAEARQTREDRSWVDGLPASAQKRIVEAQERFGTLDEEWSEPTFQQLAEQKIQEFKSNEKRDKPKVFVEAEQSDGSKVSIESVRTADVQIKKDGDLDRRPEKYVVSGEIELSGVGGLPSGPQWQIRVARYDDDIRKEEAGVDLKKGTYRIQVPELTGSIYARLIDQLSGRVLGEGSFRLSAYAKDQINGRAKIVIHKSSNDVAASFGSYYQHPTELTGKAVAGTEKNISTRVLYASVDAEGSTDSSGVFRFDQVMKGSWGLLRTEAKDFSPGLFLVKAGDEKRLPLFPEKMIVAMKQIIRDQALSSQVAETGSVVWGRVSQDGRPVAGAEVDVEFLDQYRPVYFNSLLIPDSSLKATSENGFFAFINLPAGYHSLISSRGAAYLSHVNVVVDADAVSIAEMESSLQTEKVDIKVFDALAGTPQEADLEVQSLGQQIHAHGFAQIDLQAISRLSFLRIHPTNPEYYEALQLYDDSADAIHIPLISKTWIAELLAARRANVQPDTGLIVGFVPSSDFEVYLSHEKEYPSDNIIYFTAQGKLSDVGVQGGGFILQNVPQGAQSVVLAAKNAELIQTQVAPVDASDLVVLKFR